MQTQNDEAYEYEAAYTSSIEPDACWNATVLSTFKATSASAPSMSTMASPNAPNTAASSAAFSSITYLSTDAPLGVSPVGTANDSIGPTEPIWSLVAPRKKPKKNKSKKIQQVKAEPQLEMQARRKVADRERQFLLGATSTVQISTTSGQACEGEPPRRKLKPRGERAGKLVTNRQPTTAVQPIAKKRSWPDSTTRAPSDVKRARVETGQTKDSYAAAFKTNDMCVAVMAEPFSDLTAEQANRVKTCLENKLIDDLLDPSTAAAMAAVGFRGKAHFSEGVLKMWCEDEVTLQWLRRAVENIPSPITGSTLVVRPQGEIQRRILCGLLVPEVKMDINTVRQVLTAQNSGTVNVRSWTLVKAEKQTETETPSVYLLLRIPESDVDKLKKQERRVNWMLGSIYIRILDKDSRKPSACAPATPAQANRPKTPELGSDEIAS